MSSPASTDDAINRDCISCHNDESPSDNPVNPLTRRIRGMVQTLVSKDRNEREKPLIFRLRRASWQERLKLVIGLFCSAIFLCQTYESISYYLSVPVVVDVSIDQPEYLTFPAVTVCFGNLGQLANLLLTPEQKTKLTSCEVETNLTGQQVLNASNIDYWNGRTDINANWISAKLEPKLSIKPEHVIILPEGLCTKFYTDSSVKFQGSALSLVFDLKLTVFRCGPQGAITFSAHLPEEKPFRTDFRTLVHFQGASYGMSTTMYKFINRKQKPCSNFHTYWDCMNNCINTHLPQLVECRIHYMSPKLSHFRLCSDRTMFRNNLFLTYVEIAKLDPNKTCNCIHPCEKTLFKMNHRPRPAERIQRLSLFFEDNYITKFEERIAYGFITLLCDVGGIMGFYLGWSLLSVFDFGHIINLTSRSYDNKKKIRALDPIYVKVCKYYEMVKIQANKSSADLPTTEKRFKPIWYIILLLCVISCVYVTYDKVMLYLSIPVVTTVELRHQSEVEIPILTYCKDNYDIMKYKRQIARSHNLKSFCEVDFLDILDIPGFSSLKLWDMSLSKTNITDNSFFPHRRMQILGENCVEFSIGKIIHYGRNVFKRLKLQAQCNESIKVYITSPGSEFEFSHYYNIPNDVATVRLQFKMQEHRVNSLLGNCITSNEAKQCKENCINKRMIEKLKCRLPLMLEEYIALPLCTTSAAAKQTRATYINILTSTDATIDCNCQRQCRKKLFESDIVVMPGRRTDYPTISLFIGYVESDSQIFNENPSYTFTNLFCDIGGILGLLLGFSFLESMDAIIGVLTTIFKKLNR